MSTARDVIPSLASSLGKAGIDQEKIRVVFRVNNQKRLLIPDRQVVPISDGGDLAVFWPVPKLTELFRGDGLPPADIDRYPEAWVPLFYFVERHVLMLCEALGDRTDQELEEIYDAIRRRPDGRSLGPTHDAVWQVAALLLGQFPLSEQEFAGVFGALVGSTRKWGLRPVSRFYAGYLRSSFM